MNFRMILRPSYSNLTGFRSSSGIIHIFPKISWFPSELSDESGRAQNPPVAWCYLTPAPNDPGLQLVGTFFILHKPNSTCILLGDGESLRTQAKFPGIIAMIVLLSGSICYAATVTGTVKDPKGAPFAGAFVQAQNIKTHVTFMALSDVQGRYRVENIPPGDYRILIRAIGYRTDPRSDINLTADKYLLRLCFAEECCALERHINLSG